MKIETKTEDNFFEKNKEDINNNFNGMETEILTKTEMRFLKFFKDIENHNQIKVLFKSFNKHYIDMNKETTN